MSEPSPMPPTALVVDMRLALESNNARALSRAFPWSHTDQGYKFWSREYDRLRVGKPLSPVGRRIIEGWLEQGLADVNWRTAPQPEPVRTDRSEEGAQKDAVEGAKNFGALGVAEDLRARAEEGEKKYGTPLLTFNGRNPVVDLYQEILDALVYEAQARMEGGGNGDSAMSYRDRIDLYRIAGNLRKRLDEGSL